MFNLSDFKEWETLIEGVKKGAYNLFLGAGATHECLNKKGNKFLLGRDLADKLCELKNISKGKKLNQITKLFKDKQELFADLLIHYFDCDKLSSAVESLSRYVWKGIYTLNVDNAYR